MVQSYFIIYMYHIDFIHSSVDRHLGCFHFLATAINQYKIKIQNKMVMQKKSTSESPGDLLKGHIAGPTPSL